MKTEEEIRSNVDLLRAYYKQETENLIGTRDPAQLLKINQYRSDLRAQISILEWILMPTPAAT